MFKKKGKVDPMMGESSQVVLPSYFRNPYCVVGMVSTNPLEGSPSLFSTGEKDPDLNAFVAIIVNDIANSLLLEVVNVVVDNVVLHLGVLAVFFQISCGMRLC